MRRRLEGLGRIGNVVVVAGFTIGAAAWTLEMSRRSVAFAFWINWALMGLAFVIWLVAPARLGRSYYRVHGFERSGRLYGRLGVRYFQRFLRRVGIMNPWLRYRPGPSASATLLAATEGPETAHLMIFVVLSVVSGEFVRRGWWDTAGWLLLFNVALNAYPVLSLRSVRAPSREAVRRVTMVFTKRLREGVRRGRIRCSVRIWRRPLVKAGGRYRMEEGQIAVDSIEAIRLADITRDLARESGFDSVKDLLQMAKHGGGNNVYLIRFRYLPPGAWDVPPKDVAAKPSQEPRSQFTSPYPRQQAKAAGSKSKWEAEGRRTMKVRLLTAMLAVTILAASTSAQTKPSFAGKWTAVADPAAQAPVPKQPGLDRRLPPVSGNSNCPG